MLHLHPCKLFVQIADMRRTTPRRLRLGSRSHSGGLRYGIVERLCFLVDRAARAAAGPRWDWCVGCPSLRA
jgi:hypothetical protein